MVRKFMIAATSSIAVLAGVGSSFCSSNTALATKRGPC